MLEQELHNQESNNFNYQEMPTQTATAPEPDLFRNYEIKNFELTPRLYKIIAASAIFNVMALLIFAQSNLLTRKGCDSPMVSKVCQVLDTVYIASILMGTDGEFVSKDYEKTELEDAEITYIDVSGQTPPLNYPEGYFALANPEEYAMRQQQMQMMNGDPNGFTMPPVGSIPTNPITPNNDLMNVTPTLPPQNNNPIIGNVPTSPLGSNPIGRNPTYPRFQGKRFPRPKPIKTPKIKNESPKYLPDLGEETAKNDKEESKKEDQKLLESEPVKEVEINKKPFEDLGDNLNEKLAKKEVDLSQPFSVVLDGALTADGKLDPKKSRFVELKGDERMIDIAKSAIEAVGNSGFLGHLKNIGIDKVKITLVQDDKQIYAIVTSDQKSVAEARSTASGFNTILSGLKIADQTGLKKLDDNSKTLVNNSKVTSDGKNFVLNFAIPKQDAQMLINKSLKDRAEKKASQPDSKSEINSNTNAKSVK